MARRKSAPEGKVWFKSRYTSPTLIFKKKKYKFYSYIWTNPMVRDGKMLIGILELDEKKDAAVINSLRNRIEKDDRALTALRKKELIPDTEWTSGQLRAQASRATHRKMAVPDFPDYAELTFEEFSKMKAASPSIEYDKELDRIAESDDGDMFEKAGPVKDESSEESDDEQDDSEDPDESDDEEEEEAEIKPKKAVKRKSLGGQKPLLPGKKKRITRD